MKRLKQMPFKVIIILILFSSIFACSSSPATSQKSVDTRACNALSYGNKNVDIQEMDGIYKTCMDDKKKIRKQQSDKAKNLAIIDFLFDLFLSSDN
mgnify:CR=1 FL=1